MCVYTHRCDCAHTLFDVCESEMSPDCVLFKTHTQCGSVCRPEECERAPGSGGEESRGCGWREGAER